MFSPDIFPPPYCEERAAAEAARRLAQQQQAALEAQQQATKPPTSRTSQPQQPAPSSLGPALRPQLSRPGSSTVLGNIFQGFVRASHSGTSTPQETSTRAQTPVSSEEKARIEAQLREREKNRDVDICALPGWH